MTNFRNKLLVQNCIGRRGHKVDLLNVTLCNDELTIQMFSFQEYLKLNKTIKIFEYHHDNIYRYR